MPKPNVTANSTPRASPSTFRPSARCPSPGKISERTTASRGSTFGRETGLRITCAKGVPHTEHTSSAIGFSAPQTEQGQKGSRAGAVAAGEPPGATVPVSPAPGTAGGDDVGSGTGSGTERREVKHRQHHSASAETDAPQEGQVRS